MRFLPALADDRFRWVLPTADRSAAALLELLLADDAPQAASALAEELAWDPPLVLWGVWVAAHRDGLAVRSVAELARWLADRAGEVLQ